MRALARSISAARQGRIATSAAVWLHGRSWWWGVALLVGVSIAIRSVLAVRDPAPWLFQDEVLYAELAHSMAEGSFSIRGSEGTSGFGLVYPLLIAPAYAIFSDSSTAYAAAKVINATMMSLVAVPVFLMARSMVSNALAFVAAALALALPALTFSGQLLTENAFLVVFMASLLTMVRMVERPSASRQIVALVLIGVAYATRAQGLALVPTLLAAVFLDGWLSARAAPSARTRAFGARLKQYWPMWTILIVAAVAWLALQISRGESLRTRLLGAYAPLESEDYSVASVARFTLYHLSELDYALGILPFAAFLVVVWTALRQRDASPHLRAFVVVAVPATIALTLVVAAFASSQFSRQIEERNLFYIMPLFLIALVVWARHGPFRSTAVAAAAVIAAALPTLTPLTNFINARAVSETHALMTLRGLVDRGVGLADVPIAIGLAAVVAGVAFALVPRRLAVASAPLVVLAYLALSTAPIERITHRASVDSGLAGVRAADKDWIDEAVGSDADAATVFTGLSGFHVLWVNEIFNRSLGPLYNMPGQLPDGLPQTAVAVDASSGALVNVVDGSQVAHEYMLSDRTLAFVGDVVARDAGTGMALYRTEGDVFVEAQVAGLFPDTWSGATVAYTRYGCSGGTVTVLVTSDPRLHPEGQTVTATIDGETVDSFFVPPGELDVPLEVELPSEGGVCGVAFNVAPIASPNAVYGSPDARELGVRFVDIMYVGPRG